MNFNRLMREVRFGVCGDKWVGCLAQAHKNDLTIEQAERINSSIRQISMSAFKDDVKEVEDTDDSYLDKALESDDLSEYIYVLCDNAAEMPGRFCSIVKDFESKLVEKERIINILVN